MVDLTDFDLFGHGKRPERSLEKHVILGSEKRDNHFDLQG